VWSSFSSWSWYAHKWRHKHVRVTTLIESTWLTQHDLFFKFVHGTILLISVLTKQAKILHILSLEDDSHNHVNFDTLHKDRQSFYGSSNSNLFATIKMLHSYLCFWSYHPCYKWTIYTTSILSCLRLEKNE
jgi:hypothetical protein